MGGLFVATGPPPLYQARAMNEEADQATMQGVGIALAAVDSAVETLSSQLAISRGMDLSDVRRALGNVEQALATANQHFQTIARHVGAIRQLVSLMAVGLLTLIVIAAYSV